MQQSNPRLWNYQYATNVYLKEQNKKYYPRQITHHSKISKNYQTSSYLLPKRPVHVLLSRFYCNFIWFYYNFIQFEFSIKLIKGVLCLRSFLRLWKNNRVSRGVIQYYSHHSIKHTGSITRPGLEFFKKSLLNVPYDPICLSLNSLSYCLY